MAEPVATENEGQLKNFVLFEKASHAGEARDGSIKATDTHAMISKVQKDLQNIDYDINRCIQGGLTNFAKLHITTKQETQLYRDKYRAFMERHKANQKAMEEQGKKAPLKVPVFSSPEVSVPWTPIQFVTSDPLMAYVDAEHRTGAVRFYFRGRIPKDLNVHISENYMTVNETNATWSYVQPSVFTLLPRDQNILNPSKQTDKDGKKFQVLYLSLQTSQEDAKFSIQVNFPDEEEYERRRK